MIKMTKIVKNIYPIATAYRSKKLINITIFASTMALTSVANAQGEIRTPPLPADASPDTCYTLAVIPAQTQQQPQRIEVQQAHEVASVIPPTYKPVQETITLRPAYKKVIFTEPEYRTETIEIELEPAQMAYDIQPAQFETIKKSVKTRERYETWDPNCSAPSVAAGATGGTVCRQVIPPHFELFDYQKLVQGPQITQREIKPAKMQRIEVQRVVRPAQTRQVTVPAQTLVVTKMVLDRPKQEKRKIVEARFDTVLLETIARDSRVEWRKAICNSVITYELAKQIQMALKKSGYNPGPVDGQIGLNTMNAISAFQQDKKLPYGGLTYETLAALGLKISAQRP